MFTQYKFSPSDVSGWCVEAAKGLAQVMPGTNAATFAGQAIAERLVKKPGAYLEFGPYWWAVKLALFKLGHDFGPSDDTVVCAEYGANLPLYGALVAGERFKDYCRGTFLMGSRKFDLDDEGEQTYVLADPDMDARIAGLPGPMTPSAEGDDGEGYGVTLDSVEVAVPAMPFRLNFEMDGALWTADLFAHGVDEAKAKLKGLEASGRIGLAVDFAKGIGGEPTLDNTDFDKPLFVDLKAKRICEVEAV